MAIGSVIGALLSARRSQPRLRLIILGAAAFGVTCTAAALMPTYVSFAVTLTFVGLSSLTLMTTANAYVQTTTEPAMRGRVMALYMAIFAGGTPLGAPLVGWVADQFGPRWAVGVAALSGLLAAAVLVFWLFKYQGLRVHYRLRRSPRMLVRHAGDGHEASAGPDRETATREIAVVEATTPR
jgi:MFS family permease